MLVLRKRIIMTVRMENVYFVKDYKNYHTNADIVLFYSCGTPPGRNTHGIGTWTQIISLEKPEAILWANLRKSLRRDISKIMLHDEIYDTVISSPSKDELEVFLNHFNYFARIRSIHTADAVFLEELRQKGVLAILYVMKDDSRVLCGEVDIILPEVSYGAYAFSNFQHHSKSEKDSIISSSMKLLYWKSIMYAKEKGCLNYDMAGLANGEYGSDKDGIDNFKKAFGGDTVREYTLYHARTLKGKVILPLIRLLKKDMSGWDNTSNKSNRRQY